MSMEMQQDVLRRAGLTISSKTAHELLRKGHFLIRLTTDGGFNDWDTIWVVESVEPVPRVIVADSGEVVLVPSGGYLIEESFNADFDLQGFGYRSRDDVKHSHFGMD